MRMKRFISVLKFVILFWVVNGLLLLYLTGPKGE